MLRLTIVRHAKSSWTDPDLSDFERPLNERGRRDAPRMAALALNLLGRPECIVSSPALRALTTARIFAEVLGIDTDALLIHAGIYEASLPRLLELVRGFDDAAAHVMLFGHNPGLSELAHALAACPFEDLPTCALAQIEFDVQHWRELQPHSGRLTQYRYPKQLKP